MAGNDGNTTLPIEAIREDFLHALNQGSVVVEAPTGSGKSTRLPHWCAEHGRTLVVEPRRLACRSLARYLASQVHGGEGTVGYAVRFDLRFEAASRIVFATPGIALRWFASTGLRGYDAVILDEFHERRWDTDLLAALLVSEGRSLVLTSATFEGERLAGYVQGTRLRVESGTYPVEVRYAGRNELPSQKGLDRRVAEAVRAACREDSHGDVLVFLPGRGEIEAAGGQLSKGGAPGEIIPLHASVPTSQQDRALKPSDTRRIILATNVAETSLTIPGVTVVVDSGLERRTQHRNGRTVLALSSVSRAVAEQRRGRAGRLAPGLCIRLWGSAAKLEAHTPPEVCREELTDLFLAAAVCGCPADQLDFPDPLPEHAAARARQRLEAMGALNRDGTATDRGRQLFPLPLDPLLAHLVLAMPDRATQAFMIDLSAALSADGSVYRGPANEKESEALRDWAPEPCDATTLVRLVRADPPEAVKVSQSVLKQARRIASQLDSILELSRIRNGDEAPPREAFLKAAVRAEPELAFVRRRRDSRKMGNELSEVEIGAGSRFPAKAQAGLVLDQHSLPGRGTTRTISYATCLAPVPLSFLAEAGLGRVCLSEPRLNADGTVRVLAIRTYAGRRIEEREIVPQGKGLRQALARLIVEGKLFPGIGDRIREDVQAWNLALALGQYSGEESEPESWLTQRLSDLGLEEQEDIQLLDREDLRFPGIPADDRSQFDRHYPRYLHLGDLELDVDYDPKRKTITLVKRSGQRRNPPSRMELPTWSREWSLRYKEGNRVVPLD